MCSSASTAVSYVSVCLACVSSMCLVHGPRASTAVEPSDRRIGQSEDHVSRPRVSCLDGRVVCICVWHRACDIQRVTYSGVIFPECFVNTAVFMNNEYEYTDFVVFILMNTGPYSIRAPALRRPTFGGRQRGCCFSGVETALDPFRVTKMKSEHVSPK